MHSSSQNVGPKELIARFLLQSGDFAATKGRVKHGAFLPPKKRLQTSVFRVLGLTENSVWKIGRELVAEPRGKTLYGRGQVKMTEIIEIGLDVEPDEPPQHHANIVNWPTDKEHRISLSQELAAVATLFLVNQI